MAQDIQKQKPFSVNQIESTKPSTPRSNNILSGYFANSMNGGVNKTIAYKKIMAGEKHNSYRLKANFQMLTPLTPTYQNLKMTIRAYFVPNSRVWENAEKYTAQKGGTSEIKIKEIPNLGGKKLYPVEVKNGDAVNYLGYQDTVEYRDSFLSSYVPRIGQGVLYEDQFVETMPITLPKISVLPLRGRIAIYNDMERNKEYDTELQEYKGDEVSDAEWGSYINTDQKDFDILQMRAKREDNYYTNYRTELQGFETEYPPQGTNEADTALISWATWESRIAETRAQAENAQRNDWDIIAQIRGSKTLTEGKVQKIAEKTFNLNYSAITQNAYNNNQDIREDFRVLGKQGAYSYTEIDLLLYSGVEFIEEGYLHIIATVSADTVFENGIDRNLLNVEALSEYRPDLVGEKNDIIYECEFGTSEYNQIGLNDRYNRSYGFKRKFSEYFKLPNIIAGDITSKPWYQQNIKYDFDRNKNDTVIYTPTRILTNSTYQFFEENNEKYVINNGNSGENDEFYNKKHWKDYTDLMINKNQAIRNKVVQFNDQTLDCIRVMGQNQVFFVGIHQCICDMPIDESIKDNYSKWGEH